MLIKFFKFKLSIDWLIINFDKLIKIIHWKKNIKR